MKKRVLKKGNLVEKIEITADHAFILRADKAEEFLNQDNTPFKQAMARAAKHNKNLKIEVIKK